jgi:tetratricopeptide (TPR) repeat protein
MVSLLACSYIPAMAVAEEELFDTKAAATHMEKGVHLLKANKIDLAIEEFEEAAAAAPDAEAHYLLGYAYYLKGKAGDSDARMKAMENFEAAYQINPNFSPNKFKPSEPITVPGSQPAAGESVTSVAPARTLEPAEQPKQ